MSTTAESSRKAKCVIPNAPWPIVPLSEVVEINPRPEKLPDEMLASFVPMKCVEEESGRFTPIEDRKVKDVSKGYTPFRDGDVLFAKVTPCMENGKAVIVKGLTNGFGFGSTELFALRPTSKLLQKFLFYFVIQESFRRSAAANMTGAVGLRRVPKSYLAEQPIPLPPLSAQRRIVAEIEKQFTRLDTGVAALRRAQANLKRYRAAVLKAACEGRLVPSETELHRKSKSKKSKLEKGAELLARVLAERRLDAKEGVKYKEPDSPNTADLPDLPEAWTYASVEQLGFVQLGRQRAPQHHTGKFMRPYLRVANVFEDRIDLSDVKEMNFTPKEFEVFQLKPNDILLNEGQSLELIGRPAIYRGELPGACFTNTLVRFRPCASLNVNFAFTVFRAYMHSGRFQKIAKWTTNIAHLGADRFAKLAIPLPPLAEQQRIVTEVERRLSVVNELESVVNATLQRATRLRQSILRKAFTGSLE